VFSPDDVFFAGAFGHGGARCWRTDRGVPTTPHTLEHTARAQAVAFHPNDPWVLAVGRGDGGIPLFHADTGKFLRMLGSHTTFAEDIRTIRFTPNGAYLLVGTSTALLAYDVASGVCAWCVNSLTSPVTSLAYTPDAQLVIVNASETWGPWHGHGYCTLLDFGAPNLGRARS
jgi:WD40 repeat protein